MGILIEIKREPRENEGVRKGGRLAYLRFLQESGGRIDLHKHYVPGFITRLRRSVMRILLIFLTFICISSQAFGGGVVSYVAELGVVTERYALFRITTAAATKPDCATNYKVYSFDKTTQHGRDMFTMVLTSLVAQKKLQVDFSDTDCGLYATRALVYSVRIFNE